MSLMNPRPASLLLAIVLVGTTGVAALLFAALLFVVAAGAVSLLGPGINAIGWTVAAAAVGFGVFGVAAAFGLWRRRPWARPVAAVVQLIGTLGAILVIATSGPQGPTVLGVALVAGGLVAVLAPATRRAKQV